VIKTGGQIAVPQRQHFNTGQLFNFAQGSYLERTSRPVYAIVFLLPFIVFYELGTVLINTDVLNETQVRVVAFAWLQNALEYIGFTSTPARMAPPLVVVVILIALQLSGRKRWEVNFTDMVPMAAECVLLAVPLIVLGLFLNSSPAPGAGAAAPHQASTQIAAAASRAAADKSILADIVTGIGAGIYEELVFRLFLICVLMMLFQDALGLTHNSSIALSILVAAALFSAHHHVVFIDGGFSCSTPFSAREFGFRTIAGIYFAILFAIRGFGTTAGTHAFYDIIAVCVNSLFFRG
jgi:hypothetical protein